eukprot:7027595-Pyramimonas_sp.AAC.1
MFESAASKEFATLFRAHAKPPAPGPPPEGAGAADSAGRAGAEQPDHIGQHVVDAEFDDCSESQGAAD